MSQQHGQAPGVQRIDQGVTFSWLALVALYVPAAVPSKSCFPACKGSAKGSWIRSRDPATVSITRTRDAGTSILTISTRGKVLEQHPVSSILYSRASLKAGTASRALFLKCHDLDSALIRKLAAYFLFTSDADACWATIKEIIAGKKAPQPPPAPLTGKCDNVIGLAASSRGLDHGFLPRIKLDQGRRTNEQDLSTEELKRKLVAYHLDPEFQEYVAKVEAAWKELETSLAPHIAAAEKTLEQS